MDCTLVTDGPSDAVLRRHLAWLLRQHVNPRVPVHVTWADLRSVRKPHGLGERLKVAVDLYPCELLFVHRDAEAAEPAHRREEILRAAASARIDIPLVCVIPVRMTEAWLLFDEAALRQAAGNPNGITPIPWLRRSADSLPNPKGLLQDALRAASGLKGRRLKRFNVSPAVHRIADSIDDFSPLRELAAFRSLESELREFVEKQGWS